MWGEDFAKSVASADLTMTVSLLTGIGAISLCVGLYLEKPWMRNCMCILAFLCAVAKGFFLLACATVVPERADVVAVHGDVFEGMVCATVVAVIVTRLAVQWK